MKSVKTACSVISVASILFVIIAWGFHGHRTINRMAVFTLPPTMIGFYKKNIEYISENAVRPDKRRYAVPDEAPRHYIDLDHYGSDPFEVIPQKWTDAVAKFSEDTLQAHGIVPWHIDRMLSWLTEAFRKKDPDRILSLSADIGHYIADAHVPLHCTKNYNGQLTNQVGIHGLWESRIPELFSNDYDYFLGRAKYINDPLAEVWKIVKASFLAVDSVLLMEREVSTQFPPDQKYTYEQRGAATVRVYSKEFAAAYDKKMAGMVERRLREATISTGSFWYTAWVNAGQPDLDAMMTAKISEEHKKQIEEEDKMWRTGKPPVGKGHED